MPKNVKLQELGIDEYAAECVDIDDLESDNIDDAFIKVPSQLAYWNTVFARAAKKELEAKFNVKRTHAERSIFLREELLSTGGKATESMIEARVSIDDQYKLAYVLHIEALTRKTEISGFIEAIKAKKDALVTVGANIRAEKKDISINREEKPW